MIRLVLEHLDRYSLAAERLLYGTRLVEGDDFGLTAARVRDTLHRIGDQEGTVARVRRLATALYAVDADGETHRNPAFACAIAALQYPQDPRTLPPADDAAALHEHYRSWYNTNADETDYRHCFAQAVKEIR